MDKLRRAPRGALRRGSCSRTAPSGGRASLRPVLTASVLVVAALGAACCGENEPPTARAIPGLTIDVRRTDSVDVARYFSDPDTGVPAYAAITSGNGVATASVSESVVTVSGVSEGASEVTVTATERAGCRRLRTSPQPSAASLSGESRSVNYDLHYVT
ncbi:MAG: hypothetical protein OXG58_09530 [Gemmatimonadetes bacterium]|nr:hypothetical protein [Gemmatimonadota bacterium]MCY3942860.1 hypothetical protein [Gemmatimonadota bacterium]